MRFEPESEPGNGCFQSHPVLRADQQIDVFRGTSKAVNGHRDTAADRVLDLIARQFRANGVELLRQIEHQPPRISRSAPGARSSASPSFSGSLPPAWARSGLPPPFPPTIGASLPMSALAET